MKLQITQFWTHNILETKNGRGTSKYLYLVKSCFISFLLRLLITHKEKAKENLFLIGRKSLSVLPLCKYFPG